MITRVNTEQIASLRWACRRGMLELDLLLTKFLDEQFLSLELDEQIVFAQLLGSTDQDLFAWLLGGRLPPEPAFIPLLRRIVPIL